MPQLPVSILMPVRNGASTVGLAIDDLIQAMGPEDELLIVDDGSSDHTPQILHRWEDRDPRVRVITTAGIGLVGALNLGIEEASHDWVARADADDRYPPSRLTAQKLPLASGIALVSGDYRIWSPNGESTYIPCALGHPFVALSLINPQRIPHPGVVFNKDAVQFAGGYRAEDFPAEDLGLWMRLSETGLFVGVASCVVEWNISVGSVTHSRQGEQRQRTELLLANFRPSLLKDVNNETVGDELALYEKSSHPRDRELLLLRDLLFWRHQGESLPGRSRLVKALAHHPLGATEAAWRLSREMQSRKRGRELAMGPK